MVNLAVLEVFLKISFPDTNPYPDPRVFCFNLLKKYQQYFLQIVKNKVQNFRNKPSTGMFHVFSEYKVKKKKFNHVL